MLSQETTFTESLSAGDEWVHRVLDVLIASAALVFFAPLLLLLVLLIKIDSPGPVIFKHQRIGRSGRFFYCLKLRTMAADADVRLKALLDSSEDARKEWGATQKLKNDPRITKLGGFLRKSSLDELPQLINILFGDMALVGPRPIVADEVQYYGDDFRSYVSVRPGVTGLWQVSGRSDTSYRDRVALDAYYVQNRSLLLDIKILCSTVPAVLFRKGSY